MADWSPPDILSIQVGAHIISWLKRCGKIALRLGDLGQAMTREFNVIIEQDEDGFYVASVPALRGCHTQAKSLDVLMERVREAIELCLEAEESLASSRFIGVQRVMVTI